MNWAVSHFTGAANYFLRTPATPTIPTLPADIICDPGPICRVPKDWKRSYFLVDGVKVYYYVVRAKKELGVFVGGSGLKSDRPLSVEAVEDLNRAGISTIVMAQPNPDRNLNYMPYLQRVFEQFIMDPDSPVNQLFHKDIPRFAYGHSTGGQHLTKGLISDESGTEIKNKYPIQIVESGFFASAGISKHSPRWKRLVFNAYAWKNRDKIPRETFFGLYYMNYHQNIDILKAKLPDASKLERISAKAAYALNTAIKTIKILRNKNTDTAPEEWYLRQSHHRTPTFGQIREDEDCGEQITDEIRERKENGTLRQTPNLIMIASEEDPFSCFDTIKKDVAEPLGATFFKAKGQHNGFSEDPYVRNQVIDRLRPHLLDKPLDLKPEEEIISPEDLPERWSIYTLGNSFGRLFQGGTSLLNSATRVFQRFV